MTAKEKFTMFNWNNILANSQTFKNNKPFPYGFIEEVLERDFYEKLRKTFPKEDDRWYIPQDMTRSAKKRYFGKDDWGVAVDSDDPSLSKEWNDFHHYLFSKDFIEKMSAYSGIKLTKLRHFIFIINGKGDFNMPHHHFGESQNNMGGYKMTCLMYLAKDWNKGDPGGTYICANEDESSIIFEPHNLDNTMVLFKETPISWHGSRYITKDVKRPSIQFTLD